MKNDELEQKWKTLQIEHPQPILRDNNGIVLYIYINSHRHRTLYLTNISDSNLFRPMKVVRENLTFIQNKKNICIELLNSDFNHLFNDLILSLKDKLEPVHTTEKQAKVLKKAYSEWSQFFDKSKKEGLSENEVKGLWGELWYLSSLIKKANSISINDILQSWKGPYDKGHDFEPESKDVEVKTISEKSTEVKISSKKQLTLTHGKSLELLILRVKSSEQGISIEDLSNKIRECVGSLFGELPIFLNALREKGLGFDNLKDYNHLKFLPRKIELYDCGVEGFPKLCYDTLHEAITTVEYKISLDGLLPFQTESKEIGDEY